VSVELALRNRRTELAAKQAAEVEIQRLVQERLLKVFKEEGFQ
jgi:hypothetical protein